MIPLEISVPVLLAGAGAVGAWVKAVEDRLSEHKSTLAALTALADRLDRLVTLMLEDRLGQDNRLASRPQGKGY